MDTNKELEERLEKELSVGRGTLKQFFEYNKEQLIDVLNELCPDNIKNDVLCGRVSVFKTLKNDEPYEITLGGFGTLTIDGSGINYRGEHSYENQNVVKFNKFFKLS